jgi:hypothetical protein
MKIFAAATVLTALVTPLAAQCVQHPTPGIPRTAEGKPNLTAPAPRTPDGKPDLSGLWSTPIDTAVGNIAVRNVGDLKPGDIQPCLTFSGGISVRSRGSEGDCPWPTCELPTASKSGRHCSCVFPGLLRLAATILKGFQDISRQRCCRQNEKFENEVMVPQKTWFPITSPLRNSLILKS